MPPAPQRRRSLSLEGCRILAGQLRDAAEARQRLLAERTAASRACPLDLQRLLPIPDRLLRLGPDQPETLAWLWMHWGTTQALRGVVELPVSGPGQPRRLDPALVWLGFWPRTGRSGAPSSSCAPAGRHCGSPSGRATMTPDPDRAECFVAGAPGAVGNAGAPALRLGAWEGPLDLLLELARAQRVDLARISVAELAAQFVAVLDTAIARQAVALSRLAEWTIMAAWLLVLRSRLLLPGGTAENAAAEREAADLRRRLADRAAAQRLADWLEQRPQLGREVFARGAAEPVVVAEPVADVTELLPACLKLLEVPLRERVHRPRPPLLWRVPDALARLRALLPGLPDGASLDELLPPALEGEGPCGGAARWPARCSPSSSSSSAGTAGPGSIKTPPSAGLSSAQATPKADQRRKKQPRNETEVGPIRGVKLSDVWDHLRTSWRPH